MPSIKQSSSPRIFRTVLCILMILGMLIVTWRLFAELRNHELFFDQTLATVATGEVPLDKAHYDMTRLHLAFDRDTAFQQSVYFRMMIYNGLIFTVGFLLLSLLKQRVQVVGD